MIWTSSFFSLYVQDYIYLMLNCLFYLITYNWIKYQFDKFNKTQKKRTHKEVCWQYLYLTTFHCIFTLFMNCKLLRFFSLIYNYIWTFLLVATEDKQIQSASEVIANSRRGAIFK